MRIVVAGGAGMMGCIAVKDLAGCDPVGEVVIADRNVEAARQVEAALASPKLSITSLDLRDHEALVAVLAGADCCLNAAAYALNLDVMGACLEAGTSYVDLGGLFHVTHRQLQLHEHFKEMGISAVLGMGSAPGIPNVQARYAADLLDRIDTIHVYDGITPDAPAEPGEFTFGYAVATVVDELTLPPVVYREGDFATCEPMGELEEFCFTLPIGLLPVHLSLHSEVATLPATFKAKGVKEVSFKINYWGMVPETISKLQALVDLGFAGRSPIAAGETTVVPHDLLLALLASHVPPLASFLQPPADPRHWTEEIVTVVSGARLSKAATYRLGTLTASGSLLTGVSPSIVAQWLAEGRIPPGVHAPEAVIDPLPFFHELDRRGMPTSVTLTESV